MSLDTWPESHVPRIPDPPSWQHPPSLTIAAPWGSAPSESMGQMVLDWKYSYSNFMTQRSIEKKWESARRDPLSVPDLQAGSFGQGGNQGAAFILRRHTPSAILGQAGVNSRPQQILGKKTHYFLNLQWDSKRREGRSHNCLVPFVLPGPRTLTH